MRPDSRRRPGRPGMDDQGFGFAAIRATYRLQFHKEFTFRDAEAIVPYLAGLGVSHVYASPLMEARPGSTHGYDIVNHNRLNPEIGTPEEFDALIAALRAHGMGLILDIVPNHMGIGGSDNAWWLDVLEWGQESPFADRKSTRLNSSHVEISYAVFCLKKKKDIINVKVAKNKKIIANNRKTTRHN